MDHPLTPGRVLVVGENNPYSSDPRHALLYFPAQSAGARLCYTVLSMRPRDYLRSFDRRNLLSQDKWSVPAARAAARALRAQLAPGALVVLLGKKVHDAWPPHGPGCWPMWQPFTEYRGEDGPRERVLVLPHPSGLSREWNAPGSFERARRCLRELAPHLAPLVGADLGPRIDYEVVDA